MGEISFIINHFLRDMHDHPLEIRAMFIVHFCIFGRKLKHHLIIICSIISITAQEKFLLTPRVRIQIIKKCMKKFYLFWLRNMGGLFCRHWVGEPLEYHPSLFPLFFYLLLVYYWSAFDIIVSYTIKHSYMSIKDATINKAKHYDIELYYWIRTGAFLLFTFCWIWLFCSKISSNSSSCIELHNTCSRATTIKQSFRALISWSITHFDVQNTFPNPWLYQRDLSSFPHLLIPLPPFASSFPATGSANQSSKDWITMFHTLGYNALHHSHNFWLRNTL